MPRAAIGSQRSIRRVSGIGSYPRLRCFRQNRLARRAEVRTARREEARQAAVLSRQEFHTSSFPHHLRVVAVFPPTVAESAPVFLPSEPQALDIQAQDVDCPFHPVGINGGVCTCRLIRGDPAVETHPHQSRQRGQRPRIDKAGVCQVLLGLTATPVAPCRSPPPRIFTGDPGCSPFATGHHVCRVEGARPALLRIASRDDVLDLPVLFLDVDLAISAQSMLEGTEGLEYLTISRARLVAAEAIPARVPAVAIKVVNETGCRPVQRPDTLHRDLPMLLSSLRRLISMSARSRAGSRGDNSSRLRRNLTAFGDSPLPSATRSV